MLQTVGRHYTRVVNSRTYRLVNQLTRYGETASSCVSKMVRKVMSQMKAPTFDTSASVFIIRILATFKRVCDSNNIHKGAAMCVLPFFAKNALATTINCRMSTSAHPTLVYAPVNTTELPIQKTLLQSYPEIVEYFLKKILNDQKIT